MKSTGILFKGEMVRAILRHPNPKIQTRRVAPIGRGPSPRCPYGEAGDELWVRETWSDDALSLYPCPTAWYRATDDIQPGAVHTCPKKHRGNWADCLACWEQKNGRFRWKPSLLMPRSVCRIRLHIEAMRTQRLTQITETDAIAEGLERTESGGFTDYDWHGYGGRSQFSGTESAVHSYRTLWNSINAKPKPVQRPHTKGPSHYVAFPWSMEDTERLLKKDTVITQVHSDLYTATHRDRPLYIHPDPTVFAITFHRK